MPLSVFPLLAYSWDANLIMNAQEIWEHPQSLSEHCHLTPSPLGSRGSSMHKRSAGIYLSWLSDSLSPNPSLKELSWTTGTGRSPWVRTWVFLFSVWNLGSFYSIGLKGAGRCKSADGLKNHPWGCESGDRTMQSFSWICTWGCQEEVVGDTQLIWSGSVYLYLRSKTWE